MRELLQWGIIVMVFGGAIVALVGIFWAKLAHLSEFFDVDINATAGDRLAWIGAAMFALGLALLYLTA